MAKSKQIAKLLKADISMTSDLAQIAKMLEKKGRGGDTILAHITRREAEMLKDMGGAGTVNPETGLLEFYDGEGFGATGTESFLGTEQVGAPAVAQATDNQIPATMGQFDTYTAPPQLDYSAPAYGGGVGLQAPAALTGGVGAGLAATPAQLPVSVQVPESPAYGLTTRYVPETPAAPPPQEKSFLDKFSTQDLIRLGLAGGLGAYGMTQAKKAAGQAEAAKAEQQALQAMQARIAQGVEARGGVGAAQAAGQVEAFRQQLLQQQYDYGLKVSNIGDSLALGAIKTGMQADQALQQASANFYTQLAAIGAGLPITRG